MFTVMIKLIKYSFAFVLIFLYLANIGFSFFPEKIKTTLVVSLLGVIYYIIKFRLRDPYNIRKGIYYIIPLAVWMSLSILLNHSSQFWFMQFVLLQIVYMFGAAFILDLTRIRDVNTIMWIIVGYVLVQNAVAFLGIQFPLISDFIRDLEKEELFISVEGQLTYRAFGFGEHIFFVGGVWSAIALLIITFLYKRKQISLQWFSVVFFLIVVSGLFVARTTLSGCVALAMLIFPLRKNILGIWKYLLAGMVLITLLLFSQNYLLQYDYNTGYAYELINNFFETGNIETSSSQKTVNMWNILPNSFETWFIGDAKYVAEEGGYYMHTDVGYMRIVFYGGIVGLILYLLFTYLLTRRIYRLNDKDYDVRLFLIFYWVMVLMWMWKGHYDTNYFLYILVVASYFGGNEGKIRYKRLSQRH